MGKAFGDDFQSATNYPLVRIENNDTGHVFYARTHGHSTISVAPGQAGSTNFDVAAAVEIGLSAPTVSDRRPPEIDVDLFESCQQDVPKSSRPGQRAMSSAGDQSEEIACVRIMLSF